MVLGGLCDLSLINLQGAKSKLSTGGNWAKADLNIRILYSLDKFETITLPV